MTTSDEDYLRAADRLAREQGAIHEQWRNTALYIAGIVCIGFFLYLAAQVRLSANEQTQERWRACVQERGVEWCSDEAQARREANERAAQETRENDLAAACRMFKNDLLGCRDDTCCAAVRRRQPNGCSLDDIPDRTIFRDLCAIKGDL